MKLTNQEIYNYASDLSKVCAELKQALPIKISFYLQKNKNLLASLAQEIESARIGIIQKRGRMNDTKTEYIFNNDRDRLDTIQELDELFNLTQEVDIYLIDLNYFNDDICLTMEQTESIMFMIK